MSLKKQFLKTKPVCKVTFRIPKDLAQNAKKAFLMGEFNDWKQTNPMRKLKSGEFTTTIELEKANSYQFRYLLDNNNWINDPEADSFVPSSIPGNENSVVNV